MITISARFGWLLVFWGFWLFPTNYLFAEVPQGTKAGVKWKITYYCSCKKCCGPNAKGITASGKPVQYGLIACNWLKFGTLVEIDGIGRFEVADRGAKSLFGSKYNHIKHIDIWVKSHKEALKKGVEYRYVRILDTEV